MSKEISIPEEVVMSKIYEIRGIKVMLDRDLAELYEVDTKVLKQAVKRNTDIFPKHFMFELTRDEYNYLRSQIVTLDEKGRGKYSKYNPFAFTEHGILQLANVLRSKRARHMSIRIIEIFVKMREILFTHKDLLLEMEQIRKKVAGQDDKIELIFKYLKQFIKEQKKPSKRIGYRRNNEK